MATQMMNYTSSDRYDLQPFFAAGSCVPIEWLHRKQGTQYATALLLKDNLETVDDSGDTYVVQSSASSGIAGTTFFQTQAQLLAFTS